MRSVDCFPIEILSAPARGAVLSQFGGRCPTVEEVARIPDAHWLATPGIGQGTLEKIHYLTRRQKRPAEVLSPRQMTDAELFAKLNFLRNELQAIEGILRMKVAGHRRAKERFTLQAR